MYQIFNYLKSRAGINEDVSYTPEKARELINKYEKEFSNFESQAERLYNIVGHFTLGDLLENGGEDKLQKIENTAEKLKSQLDKADSILLQIEDYLDDTRSQEYKDAGEWYNKYHKLYYHVEEIYTFCNNIRGVKDDLSEEELKNLTQYKKQ